MKRPVRTPSPPPRGLDDLVPWKDYARLCFLPALGLSTRFLDKEVKAGRLRCIRFGRKKFGTQRHADQYMREKCLVQHNPPDSGLSPQNSMTMAPSAGALDTGSKIRQEADNALAFFAQKNDTSRKRRSPNTSTPKRRQRRQPANVVDLRRKSQSPKC